MTELEVKAVPIPGICFIPEPGGPLRCTLHQGHGGQHYHAYDRVEWPRYEDEKQ